MPRYAKTDGTSVLKITAFHDTSGMLTVAEAKATGKGWWLPLVDVKQPSFDPNTHHAPVRTKIKVFSDRVEHGWNKPVPKVVNDFVLTNIQFHAMVDFLGLRAAIDQAIINTTSGMPRFIAQQRFERSEEYHRNDPLIAFIAADPTVALTSADIDAAWMQAKDL